MNYDIDLESNHTYNPECIFYTNLQLLGFEVFKGPLEIRRYRSSKEDLVLDETMFQDSKQRQKAAEIVLYFLWEKIEPKLVLKNSVFPPTTVKEARDFRSASFKWLEQVRPSLNLPPHIFIRLSDLEVCHSERFYCTIYSLAIHAVKICYVKLLENLDSTTRNLTIPTGSTKESSSGMTFQDKIQSVSNSYFLMLNNHSKTQKAWLDKAMELNEKANIYLSEKVCVEKDLELYQNSVNNFSPTYDCLLERVKEKWTRFESEIERIEPCSDLVAAIAEDRALKCQVDGDRLLTLDFENAQSTSSKSCLLRKRTMSDIIQAFDIKFAQASKETGKNIITSENDKDLDDSISALLQKHKQQLDELIKLKASLKSKLKTKVI